MIATLIIVFREIIEAGLVVGIVLAATKGVHGRSLWVSYGIAAGVAGACVVALFANSISAALSGLGQEWFNIIILLLAVLMLTWHNVWMARHGREIAMEMKTIGEAVKSGSRSLLALSIVVGIAVLREGSEIVLFLYGVAISGHDSTLSMFAGGVAGLALGASVSALMYLGLLRVPTRHLFKVTGILLALLAAGMAAQAVSLLQQAAVLDMLSQTVWNSSGILSEDSIAGKMLHTLIGYTERPSLMQLIVYLATLAMIFTLTRLFGHSVPHSKPAS